jgi:hypothetical protein
MAELAQESASSIGFIEVDAVDCDICVVEPLQLSDLKGALPCPLLGREDRAQFGRRFHRLEARMLVRFGPEPECRAPGVGSGPFDGSFGALGRPHALRFWIAESRVDTEEGAKRGMIHAKAKRRIPNREGFART